MSVSSHCFRLLAVCFAFSACMATACLAVESGDLEAAPWKHIVNTAELPLPGQEDGHSFFLPDSETFAALPKLAESGNALAASVLGSSFRHGSGDMNQAVRWYRLAVKNGDVGGALALGDLYFPSGGTLGREDFAYKPDAVLGYVWYAIGLSGLKGMEERGWGTGLKEDHGREMVDGLRMLLLPSERARVAAILARWPDELPPDIALEPIPGGKDGDGDGEEKRAVALPDADAVMELVRGMAAGKIKNRSAMAPLFRPSPELREVLQNAFARMQALAGGGDKEAEYLVAWCRFHGLGTGEDHDAAQPAILARAEAGDPEALFLMSLWFSWRNEEERAIEFATRAAEKGHGKSMLLLSSILRDEGEREAGDVWVEKAAEAGEAQALERMLDIAESSHDPGTMIKWLTVLMIRAHDPLQAYRCRALIAYVGTGSDEAEVQKAMATGERWHEEHPAGDASGGL